MIFHVPLLESVSRDKVGTECIIAGFGSGAQSQCACQDAAHAWISEPFVITGSSGTISLNSTASRYVSVKISSKLELYGQWAAEPGFSWSGI
jgi:hypothetical protein